MGKRGNQARWIYRLPDLSISCYPSRLRRDQRENLPPAFLSIRKSLRLWEKISKNSLFAGKGMVNSDPGTRNVCFGANAILAGFVTFFVIRKSHEDARRF